MPGEGWRISKIANEARRAVEALDLEIHESIMAELESLERSPFS